MFVFGCGGEEMEDLMLVGVFVEVILGVIFGIVVFVYVGIFVIYRNYSFLVIFVIGYEVVGKYWLEVNWKVIV